MRGEFAIVGAGRFGAVCFAAACLGVMACVGQVAVGQAPDESAPAPNLVAPPLDGRDGRDLAFDQFRPRSTLKVAEHLVPRARFPVVDVHTHLRVKLPPSREALDEFVRLMDASNVAVCVSLDGGLGDAFVDHREFLWTNQRDRFVLFANIDWRGGGDADDMTTWDFHRPDFARRMALALEQAKELGASGLKIFKEFGLTLRDPDGEVVKIDDSRWDPIWEACGRLGLPILIHVADPPSFFEPIDSTNERWEELKRRPTWSFYGPQFPSREEVLAAFERVVARHPKTTFIGAHLASHEGDLARLGELFDKYPNLNAEIAARINETGRQPYTARDFLIHHADRVLFGTDGPITHERLRLYWRHLETRDEYFPYSEGAFPVQGFWNIYGIELPDEVLKKLYHENAARLIPGVAERLEKLAAMNGGR